MRNIGTLGGVATRAMCRKYQDETTKEMFPIFDDKVDCGKAVPLIDVCCPAEVAVQL